MTLRFDLLALAGLAIGVAAILLGNQLEGGSVLMLLNLPAALIVVGGTVGAIVLQTPGAQLARSMQLLRWVLVPPDPLSAGAVDRLALWAKRTRVSGMLALENEANAQADPFIRKGLELIIDGGEPAGVRHALELELNATLDRDLAAAAVFRNMGGYAPTIGIIGAVLGLMQVMGNLADPSELGPGIATAFVATIYGVGFANLLLLPVADRLKSLVVRQGKEKMLWIEGLLAVASAEHPRAIKTRLAALEF
jgi:chemotaxis protein MotA